MQRLTIRISILLFWGICFTSYGQFSITGEATQTFDLSSFTGTGFTPGAATTGSLDSDIWGVDFGDDGTMDSDFGDTNTGGDYTGSFTAQYGVGAFDRGSIYAYTFNNPRIGVQLANTGDGDVAVIMRLQNNTGGDIEALDIAYDVQSRMSAGGTSGDLEFWYSADNSSYTEISSMRRTRTITTSWGDNEDNVTGSISATISNGSFYYLKWVFTESTSTNAAAIGIYDIEITASVAAGSGEGTITAGATNFGDLASTSVADPGEDVFDFTISDDASAGSDAFPIQFTDVTFTKAAGDGTTDWSDVIAGARLEDSGGNAVNASSITSSSIVFSSIPITSSDVGYVPDDGSETYTLSVWFNTSITEEIDGDLFQVDLSGADFTFSGATSTITATESASSNASYNTISVTGTNWGFVDPSSVVGLDEDFSLVVAAVDAYGNVDLDDNTSTFILSRGSTGSNNLTEGGASKNALSAKSLTAGKYTYTDLQYDASEDFTIDADDSGGSFLTSATSPTIAAAVSYQTVGSGNWTADFSTIWQYWNGSAWTTALTHPTSTDGNIYIRSGHDISVDADITVDQVIIESGGEISMDQNNDNLTIADGPGDDLTVENGGVISLSNFNASPVFTGTVRVESGGTFTCTVNQLDDIAESTQIDWQTDAVFNYTNTGSSLQFNKTYFPGVTTGTYPIFQINGLTSISNNQWTINGILKVSSGTLSITSTGATIRDGILSDGATTLGNDIDFSGSTLHFGGTGSIDLDGESYSWSGKTIEMEANQEIFNGSISLDGSSTVNGYTYSLNDGSNDNLDLTISNGATINSNATGGLATTLAIDGTVSIGDALDYNFEGSSAQTLGFGTLSITNANRVTVNNSSGVVLDSDLTIDDRLTLTSGVFSTSSSSEVITISSTGIIVGASSTNYFDGPLEIQGFASTYTFHTGDGAKYRPVTITPSSSMDITAEFVDATPPNNTSTETGLASEMAGFYWNIQRSSGSGNVSIELFYKESTSGTTPDNDEIIDGTYLRLLQYDNSTTTWENLGLDANNSDMANLSSVTGTITAFKGTNDFYTIGSDAGATLLPVDLISFEGRVENQSIHLHWLTASELNNDRFEVEYSVNGIEFNPIGIVDGSGTVNEERNYSFTHTNPVNGSNYYRLKQVDFDGQYEYSSTIHIHHEGLNAALSLTENPTSGWVRFTYQADAIPTITLIDMLGKTFNFRNNEVKDLYELDVRMLTPGVYLLNVNNETQRVILK